MITIVNSRLQKLSECRLMFQTSKTPVQNMEAANIIGYGIPKYPRKYLMIKRTHKVIKHNIKMIKHIKVIENELNPNLIELLFISCLLSNM